MPTPLTIDDTLWAELEAEAHRVGLLKLGIVSVDDPRFAAARVAYEDQLAAGHFGEMTFMERTRAVRGDPRALLASAQSVLMVAVPHRGESSPVARYAQGADYHSVIHRRLSALVSVLESRLPGIETRVCVDTKPLMERAAAALAGLGFLGKNGCLIIPGLGSYVLLGGILCSAVRSDEGRSPPWRDLPWDACGACRRCLDACPTDAFLGPGRLDARRCISYLTIESRSPVAPALAEKIGERVAGCDVCQEVCPYNASPRREGRVPAAAWLDRRPGGEVTVDLWALAELGSSRYRAFVRGSALDRIPRKALRRNALLALGNRETPLSLEEMSRLRALEADPDPQIREAVARVFERRMRSPSS